MEDAKQWQRLDATVILAALLVLLSLAPAWLGCARRGRAAASVKRRRRRGRNASSDFVPDRLPPFSDEHDEPAQQSAEGTVPTAASTPPNVQRRKSSDHTSPFTLGADYEPEPKPYEISEGEKAERYRRRRRPKPKHTVNTETKAAVVCEPEGISQLPLARNADGELTSEAKQWMRLCDVERSRTPHEAAAPVAPPHPAATKARSPVFQRIPTEFWSVQQSAAGGGTNAADARQKPVPFWRHKSTAPALCARCAQTLAAAPLAPTATATPLAAAGTRATAGSDGNKVAFWKGPAPQHDALATAALPPPPTTVLQTKVRVVPPTAAPVAGGRGTAAAPFLRQARAQSPPPRNDAPQAANARVATAVPHHRQTGSGSDQSHSAADDYSALSDDHGTPVHRRIPPERRSWLN